jgi:hypothetical protein
MIGWKPLHFPQQRLGIDRLRHQAGRLSRTPRTLSRRNTSRIRPTPQWKKRSRALKALERILA